MKKLLGAIISLVGLSIVIGTSLSDFGIIFRFAGIFVGLMIALAGSSLFKGDQKVKKE
jgi:uncharacterized membrane protein YgaE (UPF0421/DUF939 family)